DVYNLDKVKRMLATEVIKYSELEKLVTEAYKVASATNGSSSTFRSRLIRRLEFVVHDQIETFVGQSTLLSNAMSPGPLTSMREVDDPVFIHLDHPGQTWARISKQKWSNEDND